MRNTYLNRSKSLHCLLFHFIMRIMWNETDIAYHESKMLHCFFNKIKTELDCNNTNVRDQQYKNMEKYLNVVFLFLKLGLTGIYIKMDITKKFKKRRMKYCKAFTLQDIYFQSL